jgi:uncharacterized protein YndB with AHSA1/START domain
MRSTRIVQYIDAPRERVYRALIDADAIACWKTPDDMTCTVHSFDAREGGAFRISLIYKAADGEGKTAASGSWKWTSSKRRTRSSRER